MRDRYDPPTDPVVWQAAPPAYPDQGPDHHQTGGWYSDYPTGYDEPPGEARTQGLRRLSKLTWRATQLSAVTAVGFAALFAHTAHTYASTTTHLKPTAKPTTASPSPSATKKHHKHHHHHGPAAAASPAAGGGTGGSAPAAPAPAPPTTAPAPPPPAPSPPPTTSSGGSHGGG